MLQDFFNQQYTCKSAYGDEGYVICLVIFVDLYLNLYIYIYIYIVYPWDWDPLIVLLAIFPMLAKSANFLSRKKFQVLSRFRHPNLVILMGFARNGHGLPSVWKSAIVRRI